ncbi:hypothetical protein GNI_155730 [Gregarina niphandrodes]|uniref:Uncharacterized protein n=1 Tax=Gregarina niphandrodes TaxID=110365 RepID=A0A023AZK4_GRENI|nr:hypothetical protein GNI_155730 [Gregarina niphandrodes]EZG43931.1 hypothetical protein GNI_155730 [Gregarina niphandrodes]|eukprot:XP_011132902.1 hypothetical protein GNI_155730 [Gregarina niphandrodes]
MNRQRRSHHASDQYNTELNNHQLDHHPDVTTFQGQCIDAIPTASSIQHPWVLREVTPATHRKFYIVKQSKGCCGLINACCCGAFDDEGACGLCNVHGCCNRERKILKRIGVTEDAMKIRPRKSGCCCCCCGPK